MRLLLPHPPTTEPDEPEGGQEEVPDFVSMVQFPMNPSQVAKADERFGHLLMQLQARLEGKGERANPLTTTLLHTVMEGRWACSHAFTRARDARFRSLEALLTTFGASTIDVAGSIGAASSSSSATACLHLATPEDKQWAEDEFQKMRLFLELRHGGEDDSFDPNLESQTSVEMMGEVWVNEGQGPRQATQEERRQLEEKEALDREEQATIEDSFNRLQAARAQAEDRVALDMAMNGPHEAPPPKRMRLVYELVTRGSRDVLVEPSARLRATEVFPVRREGLWGRLPGMPAMPHELRPVTAPVAMPLPQGALEGEGEQTLDAAPVREEPLGGALGNGFDDEEDVTDADVGSVEFDEAVLQSSQQVAQPSPDQVVQVPGCPASLARAYMALFLDQSITEELVQDRFGPDVLKLFLDQRRSLLAVAGPQQVGETLLEDQEGTLVQEPPGVAEEMDVQVDSAEGEATGACGGAPGCNVVGCGVAMDGGLQPAAVVTVSHVISATSDGAAAGDPGLRPAAGEVVSEGAGERVVEEQSEAAG